MGKKGIRLTDIGIKLPTEEDRKKRKMEQYELFKKTPENMSYWLDTILNTDTKEDSILKVPDTKVIQLEYEYWDMLTGENHEETEIEYFEKYLKEKVGSFQEGKRVFLKTGIFSNKFDFKCAVCDEDRTDIGRKFLEMYYASMFLGPYQTSELVVREYIESKEYVTTVYDGMPLHTEFRVFYDFDTKEVVGVSNYWHPDVMTVQNLRKDYPNYLTVKNKIVKEYNLYKGYVAKEVSNYLRGSNGLKGKWSVDVMKNGDDYWIIDMARMERSALVDVMEDVKEEGW